jgi:hypothetical protein
MAMSNRRNVRFEVVVEQGGKPNIDGVFDDEKAATERAGYLLRLAKFPVVRVVKVNGVGKEETIFQKSSAGGSKLTTISTINEANLCVDVLQIFSFESRMTLLRLLRGYWDDQGVIPTEQLHRYFPLRYFEREALLFNPAITRLAALQAPMLGIKPTERYDQIMRMFAALKELAQQSDSLAPYDQALARGGISGLLAASIDRPVEERDRIITHAFGSMLEPHREWGAKVQAVLRLHQEGDAENTRLVDEFLAEIVDGREPIRALIGYSPDLASALMSLQATLRGDLDDRLPNTDALLALSNAVGGGGFRNVQTALLNRLCGGIEGLTPLTRTGSDAKAFQAIVDGMIVFDGFMGGPAMAEALTKRGKVALGAGGMDLPFEDTVLRLSSRLGSAAARLGFFLDLATSDFGRRKVSFLIQRVADEFNQVKSAAELAAPGVPLSEVRDGLGRRLRAAGIPRALADGLIAKIATIPDEQRVLTVSTAPRQMETIDVRGAPRAAPRIIVTHQGKAITLPDQGAEVVIGRAAECGIILDHASASRRHVTIRLRDGGCEVEDLSRNGTRLMLGNGESRLLKQGEIIPLSGRGEIIIGSLDLGERPARIGWEVKTAR